MKRFFLLSVILLTLINWMPTHAQAQGLSLTIDVPSDTQSGTFNVTFTFGAEVNGFDSTDITLTPSSLATLGTVPSGSGPAFVVPINPVSGEQGELTIKVQANAAMAPSLPTATNVETSATVQVDAKAPTLTITPPTGTRTGEFDVTFTFDEDITGFDSTDITLNAGARVKSFSTVNASEYIATIAPKATGDVTISVAAGAATDDGGNDSQAVSVTVAVDLPHQIMVMEPSEDGPFNEAFEVMIMFTESVDSFTASHITLSPSDFATVTEVTGSAPTYTAKITPEDDKDGELVISVAENAVQDSSNMNYPASNTVKVEIDTERPTVKSIQVPDGPQNSEFDVTITFSEDVTDFEGDDIELGGSASASVTNVSGNGDEYDVTIDPSSSGDLTIEVKGNAAEDAAGNRNARSALASVTIDVDAPTVTISNAPTGSHKDAFTVDIVFSEDIDDLEDSDITLTPSGLATVRNVSGSGDTYEATIRGLNNEQGDVTIQVEANAVEDTAGNGNDASNSVTVRVDRRAPQITSAFVGGVSNTPQKDPFDITFNFSENVTGFAADDITLTPSARASVTSVSGSGMAHTATITPTDGKQGNVTVTVKGSAVEDDAGNGNIGTSVTVVVDRKKPSVTLSGFPNTPTKDPFDVTITFDEEVTGFEDSDISLTGEVVLDSLTGSGADYTARLTPNANKEGEVTVQVDADVAQDSATNNNTASNEVTIHVDTIEPTVVISGVPDENTKTNTPVDLTFTFSEPVNGFQVPDDLRLNGAITPSLKSGADGDSVYVVTMTPGANADETVFFRLKLNTVEDLTGNVNSRASSSEFYLIDTIVPTVEISGVPAPSDEKNEPFDLTITFSENVNGFAVPADLTLTGPATAALTSGVDGNAEYTVRITPNPTSEGDVSVQVDADVAQDSATNNNTASDTVTIHVDTIAPWISNLSGIPDTQSLRDREKNEAFDIRITFSEEVNGFEASDDLTLEGPVTASLKSGDEGDAVYVVTITPNAHSEGDVTVQVNANAVQDFALNENSTATAAVPFGHVDTIIPTVVISGEPALGEKKNVPFDLTVTFSEEVNGFAADDLTVTGPASASVTAGTDGASEYTVTITPNPAAEGDVTVQVKANVVQDFALNANTAASAVTPSIHVDTIVPTVTITGEPTIEENDSFDLTVTFSEEVNGFTVPDDLTLEGPATAALTSGDDGDAEYTVTITPNLASEGDVTVQINANAAQDLATNNSTASNKVTIHVDTIVPTVEISGVPDIEKNDVFNLTITFSEAVNGFQGLSDDITITGPATVALISGAAGDAVYVAEIIPRENQEGDVTVQINADAAQDLATNNSTASNTVSIHIDTIVPTVVEISGAPTTEQKDPFDLTVTFSEEVNGFAADDLTVTGPATAALTLGVDGASVYTVTITPNPASEGDVTVQVNANAVQDFALNANTAASDVTPSVHVDTILPTVVISGAPDIEKNVSFDLTITFSEEVNGFTVPDDLTLTGPATAALTSGADGDTEYTVTITPNPTSEDGVTVQVNASAVQDFALNNNTASNEISVHVDTIVPTVEISGVPDIEKNVPFDLTITFSEEVNGFAVPDDLIVTGPVTASLTSGDNGDAEYTVTITPNLISEGDVTVQVNANTVQDFALNNNTASNTTEAYVDTIVPTVAISDVPDIEKNVPYDLTVTFSEEVNGFEIPDDLTIDGPVTAELTEGSDGDTEYTVTIIPDENEEDDVTVQVKAAGVQDFALNDNTASEVTDPVRIDTVPPVAEITNLPSITGGPFEITITFNEAVTGFTTEDIALTGPATAVLKSGVDEDTIYTAIITPDPNSRGDVHIQIPAGVVIDYALNENIASEITPAIQVDTNALTVQITDVPETVQLEAFSVMIKFSMDVADFVLSDITIGGDAAIRTSNLTGRGKVYMLKITPEMDTDGDVIIQVPANVATDAASNSNTASISHTVSVAPSWMPEAGLRDAAREELGLAEGEDFERTELTKLTALTSESTDISVLTGLEAATNLTTLDLSGNAITDISLLRGLTKLTDLDLSGNAITDITSLTNLTKLTALNLSDNAITDITTLANLTNLTTLDLSGNAITDITPLSGLTKLTTLNLSDNPISSLNPLSTLTALTTLGLSGNAINDLTVISGLTGLRTLDLSDNNITDITLLGNLTALTTLDLSGNTVSNLTPLTTLTQLTALYLNNNAISDLIALGGLTSLTTLELAGNTISTLNPIATLQQLTLLDLSDNNISDVATLASLASLTTLHLIGNPILDTTPLHPLTQRVPPVDIDIAVSQYTPWDVNEDGSVDATDSALVTAALGQTGDGIVDPRTDVNGDGTVDNADLLLVTGNFDEIQGAPAVADILRLLDPATLESLDREVLQTELQRLVRESDGSLKYLRAIELLQRILAVKRPDQTQLFANYPNPFNPETWIPYQLAVGSKVELVIYDVKGAVVRHLKLGHQPAGYYTQKNRAAYWDGRNAVGERVASGIYFYQLQAGNASLLRKMVILK